MNTERKLTAMFVREAGDDLVRTFLGTDPRGTERAVIEAALRQYVGPVEARFQALAHGLLSAHQFLNLRDYPTLYVEDLRRWSFGPAPVTVLDHKLFGVPEADWEAGRETLRGVTPQWCDLAACLPGLWL